MSTLLLARVEGVPGPKGSVNAFCVRCAKKHLKPAVVIKEQSDIGATFRRAVAQHLKRTHVGTSPLAGPLHTVATFYVHRQRVVKAGVTLDKWVPTHDVIAPMHHGSGDIEKHVRTIHDAMQDAGVIADDCVITDLDVRKRWATDEHPPGALIEVRKVIL